MKIMVTINGITEEIELTEDQMKQFEEPKIWVPEVGEQYYYANERGNIYSCIWQNDKVDNYLLKMGKVFQTEEDCAFDQEREIVTAELKNYAKKHNEPIDWGNLKQLKYYINWHSSDRKICISWTTTFKGNDVYFSSYKIAKAAVKAVGPERVEKYYLGVDE